MIVEIVGDLLEARLPAIGHGVNCVGKMWSGIAADIVARWPHIEPDYIAACHDGRLTPGRFTIADLGDGRLLYNLASQQNRGADARPDAIRAAADAALTDLAARGITDLGLPRIGCGIGGLDWDTVHPILTELADTHPTVNVHIFTLPPNGKATQP